MICAEIKKQLKKPFIWIFLGISLALNFYLIYCMDYPAEKAMHESELAGMYGTAQIGEEYRAYMLENFGQDIVLGDFALEEDAKSIVYSCSCPMNKYLYPFYISDGVELHNMIMDFSTPFAEARIRQINENREHLWMNGGEYLHKLLFRQLWLILGEAAVFAMLIAVKCGGYEFSEGTAQIVYSTKKGRSLCVAKLLAAVAISEAFLASVLLISFTVLFAAYPCFNLLNSPLIVLDQYTIIIPWASFTVLQYLLASIALGAVLTALFALLGYAVWGFVRNIYIACAGSFTLCAVMFFGTLVLPPIPALRLFGLSNPVMLLCNLPGHWFALSKSSVPLPWFECVSAALWAVLLTACVLLALRKLRRMKL